MTPKGRPQDLVVAGAFIITPVEGKKVNYKYIQIKA